MSKSTKQTKQSNKQKKGTLIEAARHGTGSVSKFIGRSRSEDSVCNSMPANNENKGSASRSNSAGSDEGVTASPTDSNPSMDKPDVNTAHSSNISSTSAKYKTKEHHTHLYGSSNSDIIFDFIIIFDRKTKNKKQKNTKTKEQNKTKKTQRYTNDFF